MRTRVVLFSRLVKALGAFKKMPLKGIPLSVAAQKASPFTRPDPPSGLSFRIIRIPQITRVTRALMHGRPVTANIKAWIIAWEGRDARRTP